MKKVAIIGASYLQLPLIKKAKDLRYETHVFAWEDGAVGKEYTDFFYPISIIEKEKILNECKKIKPDAIVTIASDLATVTVNYVANALGLVGNSMECTKISTNKFEMRKAFKENGIPVPDFKEVSLNTDMSVLEKMKFPLIVKPTDRSGSRSITKILKKEELKQAIEAATKDSFEHNAIVEEYIEGNEYSCECISYKGVHTYLAVTKKETTGAPHFIETGHMEPSDLDDGMIENVKNMIFKALDALKITNGASHSEFKVTPNGEIRIIEIGARMGGDCIGSHLVEISTGYDFVKMALNVSFGIAPSFVKTRVPKKAIIKFILNKEDINNLEKIEKENPEILYYVSKIEDISSRKVIDSSTRFGYYILAI